MKKNEELEKRVKELEDRVRKIEQFLESELLIKNPEIVDQFPSGEFERSDTFVDPFEDITGIIDDETGDCLKKTSDELRSEKDNT